MGRHREQFVVEAQSKSKNAHAASIAAAYNLFKIQLEEDQQAFEAHKIRLGMFESVLNRFRTITDTESNMERPLTQSWFICWAATPSQGLQGRCQEATGHPEQA